MRRSAGFEISDRIEIWINTNSEMNSIIEKHPELEPEIEDIVSAHRDTKELGFGYKFKEI